MVLSFEDTPLFDWLKKNRLFLLTLVVLVVGLQGYQYFAPTLKFAKQAKAWGLFANITSELAADFETKLGPDLAQAEEEPIIYPWVLFAAANTAILRGDADAVQIVQPKLEAYAASKEADAWKTLSESGEVTTIAELLLKRMEEFNARDQKSWTNPEPQGSKVKVVLNDASDGVYEITIGLYEDQAPNACATFLAAVEAGRLNDLEVTPSPAGLNWSGFGSEEDQPLTVERHFGLFHLAGALSTTPLPGEPGKQMVGALNLLLADNMAMDGATTVFGQVVEGLEALQGLLDGGGEPKLRIAEASIL